MRTKHLALTAMLPLALSLPLALGACSTTDEPSTTPDTNSSAADSSTNDATQTSAPADAVAMSDEVCADFFQSGPVKLADRAEKDRAMLENGEVKDPATFGEVNLLRQRIRDLAATTDGDQAALLERINAPFVEASNVILDDEELSPSDAEISLPPIVVADSATAQEEFLAACEG
ncbi:MAG: hypothetical protein Q4P07_10280 [Ornithinimicrobium sp.]|uniref:hypothetical protein n=1 Tax=Ornithinimicrobium sp. TaxID=1977084 RepID=UPI0026DF9374|nr:hypothetical protein [Ornithinimicrobium sp.]MDO5740521.1 hypothetical protein [Ornithinimicrobium sp.]